MGLTYQKLVEGGSAITGPLFHRPPPPKRRGGRITCLPKILQRKFSLPPPLSPSKVQSDHYHLGSRLYVTRPVGGVGCCLAMVGGGVPFLYAAHTAARRESLAFVPTHFVGVVHIVYLGIYAHWGTSGSSMGNAETFPVEKRVRTEKAVSLPAPRHRGLPRPQSIRQSCPQALTSVAHFRGALNRKNHQTLPSKSVCAIQYLL